MEKLTTVLLLGLQTRMVFAGMIGIMHMAAGPAVAFGHLFENKARFLSVSDPAKGSYTTPIFLLYEG